MQMQKGTLLLRKQKIGQSNRYRVALRRATQIIKRAALVKQTSRGEILPRGASIIGPCYHETARCGSPRARNLVISTMTNDPGCLVDAVDFPKQHRAAAISPLMRISILIVERGCPSWITFVRRFSAMAEDHDLSTERNK